jgi:hypothetical protein
MSQDEIRARQIDSKIVDLIRIPDRSVRFKLLVSLPKFLSVFEPKTLESTVLIELLTGTTDSHPSISEQTMMTLVSLSAHVSSSAAEKHVIPSLIRLLKDSEPTIRTNAIVSVGKVIDRCIDENRQFDMIIQCVLNGLRDPFAPARVTAIKMLSAYKLKTADQGRENATKILPMLTPLLVDGDFDVATNASQVILDLVAYIKRLVPPIRMTPQQSSTAPFAGSQQSSTAPFPGTQQSISSGQPSISTWAPTFSPIATTAPSSGMSTRPPKIQPAAQSSATSKLADTNFDSFWDDIAKPTPKTSTIDNSLI